MRVGGGRDGWGRQSVTRPDLSYEYVYPLSLLLLGSKSSLWFNQHTALKIIPVFNANERQCYIASALFVFSWTFAVPHTSETVSITNGTGIVFRLVITFVTLEGKRVIEKKKRRTLRCYRHQLFCNEILLLHKELL